MARTRDSKSRHTLEIFTEYIGTVVRPGDTLVIGIGCMTTSQERRNILDTLEAQMPGVKGIVIDNCTALAVYTPDDIALTPDPGLDQEGERM